MIGRVESIWRYPVKSMCGEQVSQGFLGFSGLYGDRIYAIQDDAAPKGFPYLTARQQPAMLRYRPVFRDAEHAAAPPNQVEAEAMGPGITPLYATAEEMPLDVESPAGDTFAIHDPALLAQLGEGLRERHRLSLRASDRALTDCRPISLFSLQSAQLLARELAIPMDHRRFRANIYADLSPSPGLFEDSLVGRSIRIGPKAVISILERDPRCKMITLDPDTAEANPAIMQHVARAHAGFAGVYAAVLIEGSIRPGDPIELQP